jgi:hypothetical protein
MRRRQLLLLPLLLLLTVLQALGPLLHAHRDAVAFAGGLHLPGLAAVVHGPAAEAASVPASAHAPLAVRADGAAVVTTVAGIEDRGTLVPVAAGPARAPTPPPLLPREGRAAQPPPAVAAASAPAHLRPAPQGPPSA